MSLFDYLLNKEWSSDYIIELAFSMLISSFITISLLCIPIGIIVYFLLFDIRIIKNMI